MSWAQEYNENQRQIDVPCAPNVSFARWNSKHLARPTVHIPRRRIRRADSKASRTATDTTHTFRLFCALKHLIRFISFHSIKHFIPTSAQRPDLIAAIPAHFRPMLGLSPLDPLWLKKISKNQIRWPEEPPLL